MTAIPLKTSKRKRSIQEFEKYLSHTRGVNFFAPFPGDETAMIRVLQIKKSKAHTTELQ
jgi:hypothetical protein